MELNNLNSLNYNLKVIDNFLNQDDFFISFFEKLAGTADLRKLILAGKTEQEIRDSWQEDLEAFKAIRKKYLLHKDFE